MLRRIAPWCTKRNRQCLFTNICDRFLWRLAATLFAACALAVDNDALAAITRFRREQQGPRGDFYEGERYPAANPDVDSDGDIDPMDMAIVASNLGRATVMSFHPVADFDGDGCITDRDVNVITDLVPILVDVDMDGDGDIIHVMTVDGDWYVRGVPTTTGQPTSWRWLRYRAGLEPRQCSDHRPDRYQHSIAAPVTGYNLEAEQRRHFTHADWAGKRFPGPFLKRRRKAVEVAPWRGSQLASIGLARTGAPIASCWAAAGPSLATGLTVPGARSGPRGMAGCRGKSWPTAHPAPCHR